ncbi:hypothetical protein AVEN_43372-1 [Araneus ventricosus]|uniref:Uncharacterized protein n=1 Tax=Araneus ventricosus TaxID=182803 RepID=A0A4Y2HEN9_ARAVE|nr:hypothetical protein AVEN_43372-1 [Araneus ventricosus]
MNLFIFPYPLMSYLPPPPTPTIRLCKEVFVNDVKGLEKEELLGILPVDSGQLGNVKGELLKLTKKETSDCQLWHNVARTEEKEEQNNSRLTVMAHGTTWPEEKSGRNRRITK